MLPELANPEVDITVGALAIALGTLLAYAVMFGLIGSVYVFLRAFFHFTDSVIGAAIGWIPGPGKWVVSKIEGAEHKAVSHLGDALHNIEGHVADAFHAGANQVRSIGHEIEGQALAIWRLAWWMHNVVKPWLIHATLAQLAQLAKAYKAATQLLAGREAWDRKAI